MGNQDFEDIELESYYEEIDSITLFQAGGDYQIPTFQPVQYQYTPVQMRFNAQESDFIKGPQMPTLPQVDFEGLEKIQGKGHTNDVNQYINSKKAAQSQLQQMVSKYGYEFTKLPAFNELINKMKVDPAELNELVVRKEMSKEFADINKSNGGENEWVTDASGMVLTRDNQTGEYKYLSAFQLSTSTTNSPVTSSEAISLNDRDTKLTKNQTVMPTVAQVWGGDKTLDHLNSQLDKIGKSEWESAQESVGGLGQIRGSDVFGEFGIAKGGSSNVANVRKLYQNLMQTMDTGAKNYFRNKAIQSIGRQNLDEDKYNMLVNQKMSELVLNYVDKTLDTKTSSKQTLSINSALTKEIKGGAGYEIPNVSDIFMHYATGQHAKQFDSGPNKGKMMDIAGWDNGQTNIYDPATGQIGTTEARFYTDIDEKGVGRVQQPIGTEMRGTRVQIIPGLEVTLKGGYQSKARPKLMTIFDKDGNVQTRVVSKMVISAADLKGETIQIPDKKGGFKTIEISDGEEINPEALAMMKGTQIYGGGKMTWNNDENAKKRLIGEAGFDENLAETLINQATPSWDLNDVGLYTIEYMDNYTEQQAHNLSQSAKATTSLLSTTEQIEAGNAQKQSAQDNRVDDFGTELNNIY